MLLKNDVDSACVYENNLTLRWKFNSEGVEWLPEAIWWSFLPSLGRFEADGLGSIDLLADAGV